MDNKNVFKLMTEAKELLEEKSLPKEEAYKELEKAVIRVKRHKHLFN